jgi:hypothetical protein
VYDYRCRRQPPEMIGRVVVTAGPATALVPAVDRNGYRSFLATEL